MRKVGVNLEKFEREREKCDEGNSKILLGRLLEEIRIKILLEK
jgi:hypothetical protein